MYSRLIPLLLLAIPALAETTIHGAGGGAPEPVNLVTWFEQASCPVGWTSYTSGLGRYIVGTPAGGTLSATTGNALTNQENRATGQHNHTYDKDHSHGVSNDSHTHSVTERSILANANTGSGTDDILVAGDHYPIPTMAGLGTTTTTVGNAAENSSNSGAVVGTNAPYKQLTLCIKD